jgi:hypothetical protein
MSYADPDRQREFARKWRAARRNEWFSNNGPCRRCWSYDNLRVYYPAQSEKVEHRLWTWKKERRDEELKKCVILCATCWQAVRDYTYTSLRRHGTDLMYDKGKCRCRSCTDAHAARKRNEHQGERNMSIAGALKELLAIKDQIRIEIDSLSRAIETKQSLILDINTAIRVLESINNGHAQDPPPKAVAPELPPAYIPKVSDIVVAPPTEKAPKTERPHRVPINLGRKRHARENPVEPLGGTTRLLGSDFHCGHCKANFMSQKSLDEHTAERHQSDPTANECPVSSCKKRFATETDMENHVIHNHPKYASEYGYA